MEEREAITFGGKFIFLVVAWRASEKTNKTDFYKGLLFLNPVTFVRPLAEFPLFIYELYIRYIHGWNFSLFVFPRAEHWSGRNHESGTCIQDVYMCMCICVPKRHIYTSLARVYLSCLYFPRPWGEINLRNI